MLLFFFTIGQNIVSQTIASYNFESGLQGWSHNGDDSGLNTNSIFANHGLQSIFSKDDDTSRNYITSPSLNLSAYTSIDFSFGFIGNSLDIDSNEGFILQYYNGSSWSDLKTYQIGIDFASNNVAYEFYITLSGTLPANAQFRFTGTANSNNEYNYFDDVLIKASAAEINIKGNAMSISNGDTTPSNSDYTAFGTANEGSIIQRTYTISNNGGANLTISNISLSNTTDFSIIAPLYSSPVLPSTGTTSFTIQFNPVTLGTKTCTVTVTNNDTDEGTYQFDINARSEQNFFDSDYDGVLDNMDVDDDNDGILDLVEELACQNSPTSSSTNYKFLNETFGEGNRTTINTTYDAETSYCYEDGTVGTNTTECPNQNQMNLNDGKYTLYYKAANGDMVNNTPVEEVASWADQYWYTGEDHTPGDTNGRMAMFNASYEPGIFYTATIIGALPNVPITYSFWVLNLDTTTAPGIATRLRPDILVEFRDVNNNVLASISTGDIPPSINGDPTNSWHEFTANLTFNVSEFYVYFINNEIGGSGNDLAIDDIVISQTLCDTDNDGVADVFDLDSDDDGIPDAVEANPTTASLTEGKGHLTGVATWDDSLNNNGMLDSLESISPVDTDGDGVADYLDLDSDNDGVFDVDESGVINTTNTTFQNGDGDINGNGTGNGIDSENFREKDSDGDGGIEGFGDGILDIYDFHEGNTSYTNSYGNKNQGTAPLYTLDSDNDGIPDYKDPTSNRNSHFYDIDNHEIYAVLPHTNGILDDTTDADGDGIMASRDGDDTVFGSPRRLDNSYSLYFDGRNDYVQDTNIIPSGDATLMAFVKKDGTNSAGNNLTVAGQDDLNIIINSTTNMVTAIVEGIALTATTPLIDGIWTHITVTTTSASGGTSMLYINGIEEDSVTSGGINDNSVFTIGCSVTNTNYFKGEIDEVRVFDSALTAEEISRMVYQELDDTNGFSSGKIIPQDISASCGSHLVKYYKMDGYIDDVLDDKKSPTIDISGAKIYNIKDIYFQRAPLPYETSNHGNWTNTANWLYGNQWDIASKKDKHNDASIVHIKHNINLNGTYNTQGTTGLIVDSGKEFIIEDDKGLYNNWYLELHGKIDLEGESQLIQTANSDLLPSSSGFLEKEQQGTADLFTYNYWSSPVGYMDNSANNVSYKVSDVFNNVSFLSYGYNGMSSPVSVADYWIWKYCNKTSNNYALWQHVRSTGLLNVGEGFTMKGVKNTNGDIGQTQNYVFNGKPNNGLITLPISANNDYLIGNPYPSAIDANEFILDNISDGLGRATSNIIDGTLYFWEHFASGTHILAEYQGGYGMYTLMGSTVAITTDTKINTSGSLTNNKGAPGQHIPVGQGFFVVANNPAPSGNIITFKNSQRVFVKETASSSVFIKQSHLKQEHTDIDERPKIKLMFDSPKGYHRQLLVGADPNATNGIDIGYDAKLIEDNTEDLFWVFNNSKYIIQAVNNFDINQVFPLGVKISKSGLATIKIDTLKYIETNRNIFLHDKTLDIYHDLRQSDYQIYLSAGQYLDRFEITFTSPNSLSIEDTPLSSLDISVFNENGKIIVHNPNSTFIKSIEFITILGQSLNKIDLNKNDIYIEYNAYKIKTGAYILKIETEHGKQSKKILVK